MKNTLTKLSLPAVLLTLALGTLVAVPALAEQGSGSGDTASTTENTDTTSTSEGDNSGSSGETQHSGDTSTSETKQENTPATHEHETQFHQQGDELVAELRQEHQDSKHTAAEREAFCTEHKTAMLNRFTAINNELSSFQARIDAILAKVENYQKTKNITVTNWDSLVAAATSAQTTSASAIVALKNVTPTSIDCTGTTIAAQVATYRQGAKSARTDLQAYKTAVKAVIEALLQAKGTSEGSNQ